MLLKNDLLGSAIDIEALARDLADVEVHCKEGGIVLWYRPLLAAWSPMLRLAYFHIQMDNWLQT